MKLTLYLTLCVHIFTEVWCDLPKESLVTIPNLGQIRGLQMTSASGTIFYAYRGIPYAKPPIGELRFRDPVAADPWSDGPLDATKEGTTCIQITAGTGLRGVEDCLKLNVYTPDSEPKNTTRPVMFWIHGGGWSTGSGNGETDVYGPRYLLDKDIVFVSINYRLGPLGFLSTEDAEAPGNYGLLDQAMALRWVHDYIRFFNGNPESVTIFGESAGAASVNHHILSPYSKGLFHRAIAESGSSLNPWSLFKSINETTKKLASNMSCPISSSRDLLGCLRGKPASDIVMFQKTNKAVGVLIIPFGPRIDTERTNPFLPAAPKRLIQEKRFNSVPLIMGLNANEGAFFLLEIFAKNGSILNYINTNLIEYLSSVVKTSSSPNINQLTRKIASRYLSFENPIVEQLNELEQVISDYQFFEGIDETVHLFTNFSENPTYYYYFAHQSQFSLAISMGLPVSVNLGVGHAEELFMIFSNDLPFPRLSASKDIKVSSMMLDLWTSFAKDGVPQSKLVPGGWFPMEKNATRYLKIESENPRTITDNMPFFPRLVMMKNDE